MAQTALPKNLAMALNYGPQTGQSVRRSQYLTDALQTMASEGGKDIRSGGELAAKLLATAILSRGSKKADRAALEAITGERTAAVDRARVGLGAMGPQTLAPAGTGSVANPGEIGGMVQPPAMSALPMSMSALPTAGPQVQASPQQGGIDPRHLDAMVRTVIGEAGQEPPEGQSAVASVILNRARRTGKSPLDIVFEPNQFEPWGNPRTRAKLEAIDPSSAEYQAALRNIAPALQGQDVTAGADHFYSPTAQSALGRAPPRWDNGSGRDLGRHRFFSLGYGGQGAHRRDIQPPEAPMAGGPGQDQMQPFQVAANGPLTPEMMPQQGMAPPAPQGPQAAPQQAPQGPPGATYWKPSQREIAYFEELVSNPRTVEAGLAYGQQLREKMAEPIKYDTATVGGLPTQIDPYTGQLRVLPVPQEAMFQTMTAQQGGLPTAPQGAYVQRDPLGKLSAAPFAPPEGFNAVPGQGYAPIRGGPQDPTRPQAPASGYAYSGAGQQTPIQGGPADPRAPANYIAQVQQVQTQIRPVVDQAIQLKRNVDAIRTGFQQQNGAGDIAMINGLQKLIDEGVVREGDVALQLKGQGIAGGISGVQGYLTSEGFFADPKIRDALLKTGDALYASLNSTYKDRVMGYEAMANRLLGEGAFEDIFPTSTAKSLGWVEAPQPAPVDQSGRQAGWSGQLAPAQLEAAKRFNPQGPRGSEQNPFVVRTPDEARNLPSGSKILLPDGSIGTVPRR